MVTVSENETAPKSWGLHFGSDKTRVLVPYNTKVKSTNRYFRNQIFKTSSLKHIKQSNDWSKDHLKKKLNYSFAIFVIKKNEKLNHIMCHFRIKNSKL